MQPASQSTDDAVLRSTVTASGQEVEGARHDAATRPGPPKNGMARTTIIGGAACAVMLMSLTAWATLAPLKSAVIANGFVKVSGYRQKVQHLEGGIIEQIFVAEGDRVVAGQLLVRLKNTQLLANQMLLQGQYFSSLVLEARIKAEQVDAPELVFPAVVLAQRDPDLQQFVEAQRNIFKARALAYQGSQVLKNEKIKQIHEEVKAYTALIGALRKQLPLIKVEIDDQMELWGKQLTRKREVHALKRSEAQIEAEIERNQALIARARAMISEVEEEKLQMRRKILDELAQERKSVNDNLHELRQRQLAIDDTVARLETRAPIGGIIVNLNVNTREGIAGPREVLMEIVPSAARLVIETSVKASDIDVVQAGQAAHIQFSSYTARRTNRVTGKVLLVSADRTMDARGQATFKVDVEVRSEDVLRLAGLKLAAGMSADVFIETGQQTFARYVLAPVQEGLSRGLTER